MSPVPSSIKATNVAAFSLKPGHGKRGAAGRGVGVGRVREQRGDHRCGQAQTETVGEDLPATEPTIEGITYERVGMCLLHLRLQSWCRTGRPVNVETSGTTASAAGDSRGSVLCGFP